jgi:hypothetical protein
MSDDKETALIVYVDPEQLAKDVSIDIADLSGALQKHASLFVHYASQAVRAKRQYERYKVAVEILEAKLDAEYRKSLKAEAAEEEGPKSRSVKPTEPQIKAAVVTDPRYKAAYARLIDAQQIHRLAEIAERSFEHRRATLIQMAQDASREAGGQLRVAANQANKDRLLDLMKGGSDPA